MVNLMLEFESVKLIFAKPEANLIDGEKVYFGERKLLSQIFNQLSHNQKMELSIHYEQTVGLLRELGEVL